MLKDTLNLFKSSPTAAAFLCSHECFNHTFVPCSPINGSHKFAHTNWLAPGKHRLCSAAATSYRVRFMIWSAFRCPACLWDMRWGRASGRDCTFALDPFRSVRVWSLAFSNQPHIVSVTPGCSCWSQTPAQRPNHEEKRGKIYNCRKTETVKAAKRKM